MIRTLTFLLVSVLLPGLLHAERIEFEQDGLTRNVELHIPPGLTEPAPLVLVLHGVLEDGKNMRKSTQNEFSRLADEEGFVVAYASAYLLLWNIGVGEGAARIPPYRDDLAYLDRIVAEVRQRVTVDSDRIYMAGFSQGGIMSYSYACNRPGQIRAISVASMGLPLLLAETCNGSSPEGVQLMHGTVDPWVLFDGGIIPSGPTVLMRLMGHDATVAYFKNQFGCPDAPYRIDQIDAVRDGTAVVQSDWPFCKNGQVHALKIVNGGHSWPNSGPYAAVVNGLTTREFKGADAAWKFFARFD